MPTTLRVIVDHVVAPERGPLRWYTQSLARALVATTPSGCAVEGIVSSSLPSDYERLNAAVPSMHSLYKTSLARRELAAAWQFNLTTSPGGGMVHAPSLMAPLRRHQPAAGDQTVVTVHDVLAWTHPESLSPSAVSWHKAMLKRARKHADAIVVPTHALAEQLAMVADLGDRVRVIGSAARDGLAVPPDAAARRRELGLPSDYLVTTGSLDPRTGVLDLLAALTRPGVPRLPLLLLGPDGRRPLTLADAATEAGVDPGWVRTLDTDDPALTAAALSGARAFIAPSHAEGDGVPLIEAFALGVPVIHSDTPAYVEIAAGGGMSVTLAEAVDYPDRLAEAIATVVEQRSVAERLAVAGGDRAQAFSWRDSAERVWQLHADL